MLKILCCLVNKYFHAIEYRLYQDHPTFHWYLTTINCFSCDLDNHTTLKRISLLFSVFVQNTCLLRLYNRKKSYCVTSSFTDGRFWRKLFVSSEFEVPSKSPWLWTSIVRVCIIVGGFGTRFEQHFRGQLWLWSRFEQPFWSHWRLQACLNCASEGSGGCKLACQVISCYSTAFSNFLLQHCVFLLQHSGT